MQPFPVCLGKVVSAIMLDLDTPRSLTVKVLIDHEEWDQLVSLRVDPAHYLDADSYFRDAAATELLRKCGDLPTSIDRETAAIEAFYKSEMDCCRTNLRLMPHLFNGPFEDQGELRIHAFLMRVRKWIDRTLGRLPNDLEGRFGPGATFSDRGVVETTIPHKIQSRPSVTHEARCLLQFVEKTSWFRALYSELPDRSDPDTIRGNRFTSVPKDATKDRGICVEPSVNIFLQLAAGGVIRKRLFDVGIDLEEGQAVHRRVAEVASKTGRQATLDLSSASDTVCRRLVQLLLSDDWYSLLASLRSPFTRMRERPGPLKGSKGEKRGKPVWIYLEKFSSMGNGFTFELETLIFLGLAVCTAEELGIPAVIGEDIYVYGDDIIVPVECAKPLEQVLRYCGFTLNTRKSFSVGPFRESCGGDFFDGVNVRPHQLTEFPNDPASWISLANGIRRMATADYSSGFDRLPLRSAWFRALDFLPSNIRRLRGPVQLGDALIHDIPEKWQNDWKDQRRFFSLWIPVQKSIPLQRWSSAVQLASAVYGVPSKGPIPRGSTAGYRFGRIALTILSERNQSTMPDGDCERMQKRLRKLFG